MGDSQHIYEDINSCQNALGTKTERCGFMHNLFNFSSFNIALNECRNVSSAHAFRPLIDWDLYSDGGWSGNLPRFDLSSLRRSLMAMGCPPSLVLMIR